MKPPIPSTKHGWDPRSSRSSDPPGPWSTQCSSTAIGTWTPTSIRTLWKLAASSPRSLVHLPMRGNRGPSRALSEDGTRELDPVLLHHSLQFAPSRRKEIRGRLGHGRPQTVTLPGPGHTDEAVIDHEARHYQENRDLFHQHLRAETLFMTGSAKVFRDAVRHFFDVDRNGPGYVPVHPSYPHFCTELHSNDGILGDARAIHIEYCDQWNS